MMTIEYISSTVKENKKEGLLFYTKIGTKLLETSIDLLDYGIWTTRVRNKTPTIVRVYHPPLGATRNTPARFLVQVSELVQYLFTNHKNLVLLGDFNIHVNRLDSQDTVIH